MNMENMSTNLRNITPNGRNEEVSYDMSTIEMMNNQNNLNSQNNYMLNSAVLTNTQQQNEYLNEMDKYQTDMISQMQLEQAMNNYNNNNNNNNINNTISMNNGTMQDPNESMYMQNMKSNIDTSAYDSYRNAMNYNNTQNTMQTNPIPMNLEDFNNSEINYMNQNLVDMYPEEFLKNLPNANDTNNMAYTNSFQMQNGNFNPMMLNNFNNMSSYPISGYENMNNSQMFMQPINQKQTRNIPLPNINQMNTINQSSMTPSMLPQIQQMQQSTNIRRVPALNKKKMKPKKFFPCC